MYIQLSEITGSYYSKRLGISETHFKKKALENCKNASIDFYQYEKTTNSFIFKKHSSRLSVYIHLNDLNEVQKVMRKLLNRD
jgi:hypothetical protein